MIVVELSESVGRENKHRLRLRLHTFKCSVTSACVGTHYKHSRTYGDALSSDFKPSRSVGKA